MRRVYPLGALKATTWRLAPRICAASQPGVEQVVAFGKALHVSGSDAATLARTIDQVKTNPALRITPDTPGLEDVFIQLMQGAEDNFPGDKPA